MFDWQLAKESLGALLQGMRLTIIFALVVEVIVLGLSIPVVLGRLSSLRWIRLLVGSYIGVFRATPLLIQLVYIYFALPGLGIRLDPVPAGVLGLSLHYTAYITEVYRTGIQAVPRGQLEAASSLGMSAWTTNRVVIFPQAFRIIVPTLGNYFVSLLKDTSLVSVITVTELLFSGQLIAARTYDYYTLYTMVFVGYLIIGLLAIWAVKRIERRVSRQGRGRGKTANPSTPSIDGAPIVERKI